MLMNVDVVVYVNWLPTEPDPGTPRGLGALALDTQLTMPINPLESEQALCRLDTEAAGGVRAFDGGIYVGAFARVMPNEIINFLDDVDWDGHLGILVLRVHGYGAVQITYPRIDAEDEDEVTDIRSKRDPGRNGQSALKTRTPRGPTKVPDGTWRKETGWTPPV